MAGRAGSADVVVVGGGIVGTSAAAFLAEAGRRVILVEREGLASAASGANSGVVQHPFDPVLAELYSATIELYRELSRTSASFKLAERPAGMLFVTDREDAARHQAASVAARFPELSVDVLGGAALQAADPALAPDLWACRVADIGYPIWPGASTYAYASLAEQRGAIIRQGRAAVLNREGTTVTGVTVNGERIDADQVLIAAGPWSPGVIDPTGAWQPIRPLWGAVVEVELARPPVHVLEQAGIEAAIGTDSGEQDRPDLDFSLVSMPGVSVVGSTFLDDEPNPRDWQETILRLAAKFVPSVLDAPIRGVRACPRPLSADGRPLVGALPGESLYICAGHGPWGISTGPGSARLVSDLMLGRPPATVPDLAPERFGPPPD